MIVLFLLDIEIPKTPMLAGLKAIDWVGVLTISSGTVMFLLGLEYGGTNHPWSSPIVICLIVFGLVIIGLFFVNEWKFAAYPIVPLRLFSHRSNVAALLICFIHGMVFISGAYYVPLYFQAVLGASPIESGVYVLPFVLALSFSSVVSGVVIKKTGNYVIPCWFGTAVMTLGFGLFIDIPATRNYGHIFPYLVVAGIGCGPLFQAPLLALQTKVPPRDIATATALFGFCRNLSTAISIVIGGVIFQNRIMAHQGQLRAALSPSILAQLTSGNAGASVGLVASLPQSQRDLVRLTYWSSLRTIWYFYVAVSAVSVVIALTIRKQVLSREHEQYKGGLEAEKQNRVDQQAADRQHKLDKQERKQSKADARSRSIQG